MIRLQKHVTTTMLLVLLLVALSPIVSGAAYPQLAGYVTDNANIIDSGYEQKITELAESIEKNTTVEIAVLTIESLEGDDIDNYAVNTFRQNGVGKKDNNNGLLILVAKNDRKYKFEVGYGLEGVIPDAMKVPIGDKIITPNFKNGDYGKGIYESMVVIEGLVTNNTEVLSKYGMINSGSGNSDGVFTIILFITFGIIVVIFILAIMSNRSNKGMYESTPYKPPPYTMSSRTKSSSSSSSSRRSSHSSYSSGSRSHGHSSHNFGGGFRGYGGGRSGGGGFGGGW